ncbi:hypothetical protein DB88DRAFT_497419 [Papiliotrema laurentii]|uniref:t-SNARE coiled-coil homology domain-containing protein n=1 Tax=Papiliotrema laurentii TaxID=5418 RepID=A0AAD9CX94_PAPLA|nr:hypothetical protein DB88DRAFT_497419 [Papiliotrema laurentii]
MSSTLLAVQSRLTTTSSLLLERSRILSLNLPPSASSTAQIYRNLSLIKADLVKLEDESSLEAGGLIIGGRKGKSPGDLALTEAQDRYDQLIEMFQQDEAGKEKAKDLRRSPHPAPPPPNLPAHRDEPARSTPSPPFAPFRDQPETEDAPDEPSMLAQQQVLMEDQDERLNLLSDSIGRQNHLSIQIGSELDLHHELLEDTDAAMDRTADRLNRAKRRLDTVAHEARQHGSTITIVVLIFILLILIIVFKT